MVYRVIGIMSGSSLDGLDIAFVQFEESGGKWNYEIKASQCIPFDNAMYDRLKNAHNSNAFDYLLLHAAFGKYIGEKINKFIDDFDLHHQVQLIASHGHTVFHAPQKGMTAQLGDGAAIAAATQINVVSDLRSMDVAFGGQGAPLVPLGEKLLLPGFDYYLNIGGIANVSFKNEQSWIGFDVCPANKVLNMLAEMTGQKYDEDGKLAATGTIHTPLLTQLNLLDYYKRSSPKSLPNSFGIEEVFPLINHYSISVQDKLRTFTEHIAMQISYALQHHIKKDEMSRQKILITGGGALNKFLIDRIQQHLLPFQIDIIPADELLINYKEALIMALLGVLRWREEYTVLESVTGAVRSSIGGAVWIGQEA